VCTISAPCGFPRRIPMPLTLTTIAQASCAICDILVPNVGILRKAGRTGGKTHLKRSALRGQFAANRRRGQKQGKTLMIHPLPRQRQSLLARRVKRHPHHEIARAITKAAPAATPPMSTVCIELRNGGAPVKCPFT